MVDKHTYDSYVAEVMQEAHVESIIAEVQRDFIAYKAILRLTQICSSRVGSTMICREGIGRLNNYFARNFEDSSRSPAQRDTNELWASRVESEFMYAIRGDEKDSERKANAFVSNFLAIVATTLAIKLGTEADGYGVYNLMLMSTTAALTQMLNINPITALSNLHYRRRFNRFVIDGDIRIEDLADRDLILEYAEREQMSTDPKLMIEFIRTRLPLVQVSIVKSYVEERRELEERRRSLTEKVAIVSQSTQLDKNDKTQMLIRLKEEIARCEEKISKIDNKINIINEFFNLVQKGADEIEMRENQNRAIAAADALMATLGVSCDEDIEADLAGAHEVTVISLASGFGSLYTQVMDRLEEERQSSVLVNPDSADQEVVDVSEELGVEVSNRNSND